MAEWARLLSECRGNLVAGSNPALPAKKHVRAIGRVFVFLVARLYREDDIRIPPSPPPETRFTGSAFFVYWSRVSARR